ncbi:MULTISPECIES: 50S ribosomal protein L30 [Methanobacterium]|jgi:large subunit ribosomal protein L30|uniref:Large ribosomal subunit protein uL30 n=1 Tax=Methanobacterium subterraneum TaxID=59277 RepID=A0A2H4VDF2_9EURY|nr:MULTISPECIES: 50S ribosomal protein L30 [Methanobacterium]MBW4257762.1 50S ribosomal protein L30 [Methanobacterium sp. YSL]PKL71686.1 MAG: 50S ribosomal protein L30 [Methanobacteriales archaeon HGW-Methanobacteriales-2]AUB56070.1 50S ribosomal protein L30 [Methanobacterium subterraneum]AUB56899.1 50S ribosomal protein L30 [Methanobacterium sp. MZ-A1]MCC7560254.1 50S ribosomal protein L30 [Methanobacterium sp.]
MFIALRVRGRTGIKGDIADTLEMLSLTRINHAVILPENPSYLGMLRKGKDYITWGEIDQETLTQVIEKRGRFPGRERFTPEALSGDYSSAEELAEAILKEETTLEEVGMKPVFRLHPPRKGYNHIRKSFREGGTLGYRGEEISQLIQKMI